MPDRMSADIEAVVGLAAVQRAVGAGWGDDDLRRVGLHSHELVGARTARALADSLDAVGARLAEVFSRIEDLGRRTAWGAAALTDADRATAYDLTRGAG